MLTPRSFLVKEPEFAFSSPSQKVRLLVFFRRLIWFVQFNQFTSVRELVCHWEINLIPATSSISAQKNSIFPRSDGDSTKSQRRNAAINTHRTSWIKQMPRTSKNVGMVAENIPGNRLFHQKMRICNCHCAANPNENLELNPLPDRPWRKVGNIEIGWGDYSSRYLEIVKLILQTSNTLIGKLKSLFARCGIPEEIVSDNAGQFTSTHFKEFAKKYGFTYTIVSPHFPQANGAAGRAVKIEKRILRQPDIFLA